MLVRLKDILNVVQDDFVCVLDGKHADVCNTEYLNYIVKAITARNGMIEIELEPWKSPRPSDDADWYRERVAQLGTEPGFF